MTLENPTFEKNPKSLDAKLTYSIFVPCLGVGAIVFFLMRSMARGYEWEMNKCYGCDLCDDACPVRLFNAGDKLNIIYNTCLLYTSPSPRDISGSRMPSSA